MNPDEGILIRLLEHNRNPQKDYWTEAVAITTSNDSLGSTEISYLEHQFCQLAMAAKRYKVMNGNDPNPGNLSEEKLSELDDFIDSALIVIGALGHKVFVPFVSENDAATDVELYCTRNGIKAAGIRTADGFVVKRGSTISENVTKSCPESIVKRREQYSDKIRGGVLTEDILFSSPSAAAAFVCGHSANGNTEWKTRDGVTLKEVEAGM